MSSLFIIIIGPDTHSEFTGDTEYNLVSLFFFYLKYIYTKADIYIYYIHINFYNIYKHAHTHLHTDILLLIFQRQNSRAAGPSSSNLLQVSTLISFIWGLISTHLKHPALLPVAEGPGATVSQHRWLYSWWREDRQCAHWRGIWTLRWRLVPKRMRAGSSLDATSGGGAVLPQLIVGERRRLFGCWDLWSLRAEVEKQTVTSGPDVAAPLFPTPTQAKVDTKRRGNNRRKVKRQDCLWLTLFILNTWTAEGRVLDAMGCPVRDRDSFMQAVIIMLMPYGKVPLETFKQRGDEYENLSVCNEYPINWRREQHKAGGVRKKG